MLFLLFEVMLYCQYCWYSMNSWNQTLILRSKYIATFNIVLSAPINYEHPVYLYIFCNVLDYHLSLQCLSSLRTSRILAVDVMLALPIVRL